jgi:alanyl-tRNA synthetase
LTAAVKHVERVLNTEEERFAETLSHGMGILEAELKNVTDQTLPGSIVFKLYDTYGFPMDLTADVARARGVEIDRAGFDIEMQAQKERARAAQKFNVERDSGLQLDLETAFTGYESLSDAARVIEILKDNAVVEALGPGETGALVLDRTPFYAESGGQVGDLGVITGAGGFVFRVTDTQKAGAAHLHIGSGESGTVRKGDTVQADVDVERRFATVLNHSATHLLHAALRQVLGNHVTQKGSLVAPDRLRFDFSHYEALLPDEIKRIEALVNEQIQLNAPAETTLMGYEEAVNSGAVALFGEKYGDKVRVLKLGDFSVELCGGTHVNSAGDIGMCKITTESGIAAGIRRIEAVTGQAALDRCAETEQALDHIAGLVKGARADVETRVQQLVDRNKALEKENRALKSKLAGSSSVDLAAGAIEIAGISVLITRLDDGVDANVLRESIDRMKDRLGSAIVVLASATADGKVRLAAGVTQDVTDRIKAGELISTVAQRVGGKGGGRADFAQAGGTNPEELNAALEDVPGWVRERLR